MRAVPDATSKPPPAPPPLTVIRRAVELALSEDLAGGDLTTEATVASDVRVVATATAKSASICCGNDVAREAFAQLDPELEFEAHAEDGTWVAAGRALWEVRGKAQAILMAERTALNFTQRMSGIATLAHRYVREVPVGCATRITDTRKTTPGLRALERYAVRAGGACNHRNDLGSAVLIKDNHVLAAGGIREAVRKARARAPHTCRIEVEVTGLDELDQALEARADVVMLDNFELPAIVDAVARVNGRALVEVSGNVALERVAELARAGADAISVGALTHSAPAADISLRFAEAPS